MKCAVMPMTDYENICNAVREKTGKTDLLKSGDISGEINDIEVGGGIDEVIGGTITEVSTNLTTLKDYALAQCYSLKTANIPFVTTVSSYCFYKCTGLKTVNMPNATIIGYLTFYGCTNLELLELPSGLTTINSSAFHECKKLTSLTFPSGITAIANNAFTNCTNLKTINVPWAEGAVANAPWGATSVETINYNYVG